MAKGLLIEMPTKGLDDLFTTQAEREDGALEKVQIIPFDQIDDFPSHPFKVRMDDDMKLMIESVKTQGILVPGLLRPKPDGRYEMVAGHRRKLAGQAAGLDGLPAVVREMGDDAATVIMVDSNMQREKVLPSEKAFAYKMKLDALNRQGARTDLTSVEFQQRTKGVTSREVISQESGESQDKIRAYIRLTSLIPSILEMVDNEHIKFRPAVELSYLPAEKQKFLYEIIDADQCTPSHAQALRMKQAEQDGTLTGDILLTIMQEQKGNQAETFKMPKKSIERFFPPGTKSKDVQETIIKALEYYRANERDKPAQERERDLGR